MPSEEPNESAVVEHRSESEGEGVAAAMHAAAAAQRASHRVERLTAQGDGMTPDEISANRLSRWGWLGLILVVVAIRLVATGLGQERLDADPDAYRTLARIWSTTGSFAVPAEPLMAPNESSGRAESEQNQEVPRYQLIPEDGDLAVRPTAYRPPLYPALLAILDQLGLLNRWGIGLFHIGLGLLTAILLAWRLDLSMGWRAAWMGAVLVTCDPVLLSQGTLVMTETLATTLVVAGGVAWAEAWQRRSGGWGVMAGVVLGLGALCRPPLLLAAVGSLALVGLREWLLVRRRALAAGNPGHERDSRGQLASLGGALLGLVLLLAPWTLRNLAMFGQPIVTTTHGGYTLLLANNHAFFDAMRSGQNLGAWGASDPDFQRELREADPEPVTDPRDELRQDAKYKAAAMQVIRDRPWDFVKASLVRLSWFWGLSPHLQDTWALRLVKGTLALFYASLFLVAAYGLICHRPQDEAWWSMLAVALVLTLLHTVYWSNLRMRAPVVPLLVWTAIAGATRSQGVAVVRSKKNRTKNAGV